MVARVPKVTTRIYSYRTMVERLDPKRNIRPEPGYVFSNGKKFFTPRDPYKSAKV